MSTNNSTNNDTINEVPYGTCPPFGAPNPNFTQIVLSLYEVGPGAFVYMWVLVILFVIVMAIFIDEANYLVKHNTKWRVTMPQLWLLSGLPCFSGLALVGLLCPRATATISFLMLFYVAVVATQYFELILAYYGGKMKMAVILKGQRYNGHAGLFFFMPCCPPMRMDLKTITFLQNMCLPIIWLELMCYFMMTIIFAEGLRTTSISWLFTVFDFICSATTCTTVYGLISIHTAAEGALEMYCIKNKFRVVQGIVLAASVQTFCFNTFHIAVGFPCYFPFPATDQGYMIHLYILSWEMFIFAIVSRGPFKTDYCDCHVLHQKHVTNCCEEVFHAEYNHSTSGVHLVKCSYDSKDPHHAHGTCQKIDIHMPHDPKGHDNHFTQLFPASSNEQSSGMRHNSSQMPLVMKIDEMQE